MADTARYKARSKEGTVHYGAETGDLKMLQHFVKEGMAQGNPESVTLQAREDVLGMMPIHVACEHGQLEAVEFLIKKRVDLDAGDNFRVTALHLAAIENFPEIVDVLLKARVDPKPADVEGDLPIHWAATKGNAEVIDILVKRGSPVDTPNKKGWTSLHRAAYNGRKEACGALVRLGAKLTSVTQDGNTPLHLACFMNHLSTIEKLCELGASQRLVNNAGQRPYDLCITDAAREILKTLQGFEGDAPLQPQKPEAPKNVTAKISVAPPTAELSSLTVSASKRLNDGKDGFPSPTASPASSFSAPKGDPSHQAVFMDALLGDGGPNPYNTVAQGPAVAQQHSSGGSQPSSSGSGRGSASGTAGGGGKGLNGPSRPDSASSGAGLAAYPMPLQGSLRPLKTGSTSGGAGAGGGASVGTPGSATDSGRPGSASAARVGSLLAALSGGGGAAGAGDMSPWSNAGSTPLSASMTGEGLQDRVREENRRMAAAADAGGGLLGGPRGAKRPMSGNKKFLSKYSLDKMNLFAP